MKNAEEVACRLTEVYYKEIARHGEKRKLDLDSVITTYLYTVKKLKKESGRGGK